MDLRLTKKRKRIIVVILTFIVAVVAFLSDFFGLLESFSAKGDRRIELKENSTYIEGDQTNIHNYYDQDKVESGAFKKYVPRTYLDNLPKIKYKAYIEAHKLWDTGVTANMQGGNYLFAERLQKILCDLAKTAYTDDFFEGKKVEDYYNEKISVMMEAAWDSQPEGAGTMHIVIATSQMAQFVDDYIEELVKGIDPEYYKTWVKKWNKADELGAEGKEIDLDLTDEL